MTIRDVSADFGYQPPTASQLESFSSSIVGPAGTYLAPNLFDTKLNAGYMSQLQANDTLLSCGSQFFYRDEGAGAGIKLVIDWVTAPAGGTSVDIQLITMSTLNSSINLFVDPYPPPTLILDFGVIPIAKLTQGYRQIAPLPSSANYEQYLGVQAVTVGTMTAGAFIAWLGIDVDSETFGYADGFSVK